MISMILIQGCTWPLIRIHLTGQPLKEQNREFEKCLQPDCRYKNITLCHKTNTGGKEWSLRRFSQRQQDGRISQYSRIHLNTPDHQILKTLTYTTIVLDGC